MDRQRLTYLQLYKRYQTVPLYSLWSYERSQRSLSSMFLTGLPTFLVEELLKWCNYSFGISQNYPWYDCASVSPPASSPTSDLSAGSASG